MHNERDESEIIVSDDNIRSYAHVAGAVEIEFYNSDSVAQMLLATWQDLPVRIPLRKMQGLRNPSEIKALLGINDRQELFVRIDGVRRRFTGALKLRTNRLIFVCKDLAQH